ncbi:MAG: glycosyltransferase [Alphaproteobacteria bacterium]|nr:glycosyltransferase [Alphaproteobacteria bacterium]MDE2111508.1 glycosyltransferase [Alphaproteobacteria bacterium]MDE2493947.1 glycosyltransferase [Alphaproteobacteria bacterium]
MKVLHVIERLENQAVENWLLRILKHASKTGCALDWTLYCVVGKPGCRDEEARALGARIVYSPVPIGEKAVFMRALRRELASECYDVLHCHHDIMSAPYLLASAGLPLRKRIVHTHNADMGLPTNLRLKKMLVGEPFRRICLMADHVVGISHHTLDTMLAGKPRRPGRDLVHYYGVNPSSFAALADRAGVRGELGLCANAKILLFGGRIVPEKNPAFAVDVLAALRRHDANVVAVFAGAGSQEQSVRERARACGVEDAVHLTGWRQDLPRVMSACDWFILPRPEKRMEGFGLAVIEAQLAGLRLLLSRGIADDPLLPTARYRRLGLGDGADAWAAAAMELMAEPAPSVADAFAALKASPMDMDFALADLMRLHQ